MTDELVFAIELHIEEKAPRINIQAANVAEEARLADWIKSQPQLTDLIEQALRIVQAEGGAP